MKDSTLKESSASGAGNSLREEELLKMIRGKDPSGMRLFYERYAGYLTALCWRYVPDDAALKDILQDTFIKAYDHIRRFEYRGEGSLKAWVGRIAVNNALKSLRRTKKLDFVDDFGDIPDDGEDVGSYPPIPSDVLQRMIAGLPSGYKAVFSLYVFEKKSHREIASLLGIKEDSSASQLFRAKAMLARQIKDYWKKQDNG